MVIVHILRLKWLFRVLTYKYNGLGVLNAIVIFPHEEC